MDILKTFLGHCLLSRPLSHGRPIVVKRHARVFYNMINYQNKAPIKLIFFILAQAFLLTSIVYPASATNKNTSNIYIQARHLRVPMMGAEKRDDRLSAAIGAVSNEAKRPEARINELVDEFKPGAVVDTLLKTTDKLVSIAGESSDSAIMVSEAILNRLTLETDIPIRGFLTTTLGRSVAKQPSITFIVINVIAERMTIGVTPEVKSNLDIALGAIALNSSSTQILVQRLRRAQNIISGMEGFCKDEALMKKIKPYMVRQASIMLGLYHEGQLVMSPELLRVGEGFLEDDELEAMFLHEIIHAERGDEKKYKEINSMEDTEEANRLVRVMEFEVDQEAARRLLAKGKDRPQALIRALKKVEGVQDILIQEKFIELSKDPKNIQTPSISERIQHLNLAMQSTFDGNKIPAELKNFSNTITEYIKTDTDQQEAIILALTLNIKLVENGIDPKVILEDALPIAAKEAKNIDELKLFINLGIKLAENGIDPYDTLNEALPEVTKVAKNIDELKLFIGLGIKLAEKKIDPYFSLLFVITEAATLEHTLQDLREICDALFDLNIRLVHNEPTLTNILQRIVFATSDIGVLKEFLKVTTKPAHDIITSSDLLRHNI